MANNNEDDVFNLGNTQASSYLDNKPKRDDGLLRPSLNEGKDGKRELIIRFLPNLMSNGKVGPTAIEKHIHYADFKQNPELAGYFDCLKNANIGKTCPLCDTFWNLHNSKNPEIQDKKKLISRSTKYYSYVLVVSDEQKPENEGKIFVFPFGFKIYQKIKAMKEAKRKPCNVEDLVHGANFELVIQEIGGYYNYDASKFESPEPITVEGKMLEVSADGKIPAAERDRVINFLKAKTHDLNSFMAADWTEEQSNKAQRVIAHLSGTSYSGDVHYDNPKAKKDAKPLTSSDLFEEEESTEDGPAETASKATQTSKVEKPVAEKKVEKQAPDNDLKAAKKKAASFFDEEDEA